MTGVVGRTPQPHPRGGQNPRVASPRRFGGGGTDKGTIMTKFLIEASESCPFHECPPGLFTYRDSLCFKSAYSSARQQPQAFCIETGDVLWRGTRGRRILVRPLASAASPIGALVARIRQLEAALFKIEAMDLPPSGRTWPDGTPMSYSAAFGGNGVRDWASTIAHDALVGGSATSSALRQAHNFAAGTVVPRESSKAVGPPP